MAVATYDLRHRHADGNGYAGKARHRSTRWSGAARELRTICPPGVDPTCSGGTEGKETTGADERRCRDLEHVRLARRRSRRIRHDDRVGGQMVVERCAVQSVALRSGPWNCDAVAPPLIPERRRACRRDFECDAGACLL